MGHYGVDCCGYFGGVGVASMGVLVTESNGAAKGERGWSDGMRMRVWREGIWNKMREKELRDEM